MICRGCLRRYSLFRIGWKFWELMRFRKSWKSNEVDFCSAKCHENYSLGFQNNPYEPQLDNAEVLQAALYLEDLDLKWRELQRGWKKSRGKKSA